MFVLILVTVSVIWLVYQLTKPDPKLKEAGDRLPGPAPRWIVGNAIDIPLAGPTAPNVHKALFEKYGSCFRMWAVNNLVYFTCNNSDIEVLLKSTTEIDKGFLYKYFYDWLGDGLIFSTGSKWHKRRKAMTPSFHFQILEQFTPIMYGRNCDTLIARLREKVDKDEFDITSFIGSYSLDVICETSMESFIDAQNDPNSTYVKCVTEMMSLYRNRSNRPWLKSDLLYKTLGYKAQEWKRINSLRSEYNKILENVKQNDKPINDDDSYGAKKKVALISALLKLQAEQHDSFQTDEDVREEVETFIFAGHETTSTGLCFALSSLARHPEIQEEAYNEIKDVLGNKSEVTQADLNQLKYLERVIKETLRLYPSVPMIGRQLKNDLTLPSNGHTVPAGTMIIAHFFHLHRSPVHFSNPLVFNPDNFLPEATENRSPFTYLPFSSGPRNCIGQKFAMLEMKSALSKLLLNYRFSCASCSPEPIPVTFDMTIAPCNGCYLKISKR